MMSSAVPLLDSNWELLSLREKNHRLYIHLILEGQKVHVVRFGYNGEISLGGP